MTGSTPAWIEQALAKGEGISVRRRKMPADVVVWMVLGACLFAGMSFVEVLRTFGLVPLTKRGNPQPLPSSGAIAQAPNRVGGETLAALFRIATGAWLKRPESQHLVCHGLRVCGIDGFTVRLPDTPSNTEAFGKPSSRREDAGYPQAGVVCVVEAATHPCHRGGRALPPALNLARMEMAEVASLLGVAPTRISFHRAVAALAHHLHNAAAAPPSKLLMYRDFLGAELAYFLLPERRTERRYPRALKVVVSRHPRNVIAQPQGSP